MQKLIPGTTLESSGQGSMFSMLLPIIQAGDGLTLSQVCSITGLEASTIQNWVKRRYVARPVNKKYRERQLARILMISALRDCMQIEKIGELMEMINGNADDESDDIIPEEKLYDYFCSIVTEYFEKTPPFEEIPNLVRRSLVSYTSKNKNDIQLLSDAMTVMVYAYIAAVYKNKADTILNEMEVDKLEQ